MGFLKPLGLLGLLTILALLIIYFLKPKYHEQEVSSTYLWKLSLKYRKRRIPFQALKKSLLLLVQILIFILLSILIAKPYINQKVDAKPEQILLIDTSASMRATENGRTRMDKAKEKARSICSQASEDYLVTLIDVSDSPRILCERESNSTMLKYELDLLTATNKEVDYGNAILLANQILDVNPVANVTLFTDHNYKKSGYINICDVSNNEYNCAILNVDYIMLNGYYVLNVKLGSYNKSSKITLHIDGEDVKGNNSNITDNKLSIDYNYELDKNEETEIIIDDLQIYSFESLKLTLMNNDKEFNDSYSFDNNYYCFGGNEELFNVEIVSETGIFINYAMRSLGTCRIDVVNDLKNVVMNGYDLYIYDGAFKQGVPQQYPIDGSLIIISPEQYKFYTSIGLQTLDDIKPETSASVSIIQDEKYKEIYKNLDLSKVKVNKNSNFAYDNKIYTPLFTTSNQYVVGLVGEINYQKIFVLGLDLHYTDLPLLPQMPILFKNLSEYLCKHLVDKYSYNLNEEVNLNVKPTANLITVNSQNGINEYTQSTYITQNDGVNEIEITYSDSENIDKANIFVKYSETESKFNYVGSTLASDKYIGASGEVTSRFDKKEKIIKEISLYFAIALMILMVIEWGLQYREQY